MTPYEFTTIRRGLIECINGIGVPSYQSHTNLTETEARALLERLKQVDTTDSVTITYPTDIFWSLRNALGIALEEAGPDEYVALTGREFGDAVNVLLSFDRLLQQMSSP
ncbi:hypothetical protein CRI94_00080 [Longibacter salinarum]|uniref:Uncharacterized protein n=1 Tax=Longibacter salinarum TaxID=1850348 RepID=A0A2A8D194_9BACT|nr:hypothetical protein CRI94_00080 [Longibacter salinarum]